jgi:hypothetical protein
MEGMLAAFAQFDNDVRSERTRAGLRAAAVERGRWTVPASLGYLNSPKWSGKSLVPDPERASLVKQMFEDYASGRFAKQEVLALVSQHGMRTRRGPAAVAVKLRPQSRSPTPPCRPLRRPSGIGDRCTQIGDRPHSQS